MEKLGSSATCEICGETRDVSPTIFEGSRLLACEKCIKDLRLTKIKPRMARMALQPKPLMKKPKSKAVLKGDYIMVEGYGRTVRNAREERGLTLEDLANALNEKVSILKKVETEKIIPPPALISKLEHKLRVELIEEIKKEPALLRKDAPQDRRVTLGEVAIFKEGEEHQQGSE